MLRVVPLSVLVVSTVALAGCSSADSSGPPGSHADAAPYDGATDDGSRLDSAVEAASDVGVDAPADVSADADLDAAAEAEVDAEVDAAADGPDDATDAPTEAGGPIDPAPGLDTPGNYTAEDCPTSPLSTFTLSVGATSAYTFTGNVDGQIGDGVFYVRGPNGEEVSGTLQTDAAGAYQKTLPLFCGANVVKLKWNSEFCPLVLVFAVNRSTCVTADITATVQWDDLGKDWELHLIEPGGKINDNATDCTWTSCIGKSPDWGVVGDTSDDPHKDIDNTGAYGPENIWLSKPVAGTYTVMVEHWGAGSADSTGSVTLNVAGTPTIVTIPKLAPKHVWTAATIAWPSGDVTTTQDVYDCSGNWSSGCRDAIP